MPGALKNMYICIYFPNTQMNIWRFYRSLPFVWQTGRSPWPMCQRKWHWLMHVQRFSGGGPPLRKRARTEWDQLQLSFRDSKSAGLRAKNHRNKRVWSMLWTSLSRQSNWPHIVPLFSRCGGILDNILMGKIHAVWKADHSIQISSNLKRQSCFKQECEVWMPARLSVAADRTDQRDTSQVRSWSLSLNWNSNGETHLWSLL